MPGDAFAKGNFREGGEVGDSLPPPLPSALPPPTSALLRREQLSAEVSWLPLWLLPRKEEALSADQFISWLSCA